MKKLKYADKWLMPALLILLPFYGASFGFMLGPTFYPGPSYIENTDRYTYGFSSNLLGAGIGLILGLGLAVGIVWQLQRQATIVIPDETLGHSDDELAPHH